MDPAAARAPHLSRRALLTAAAGGGLAALSGCSTADSGGGGSTGGASSPSPEPSPPREDDPQQERPALEQLEQELGGKAPREWGLETSGVATSFTPQKDQAVLTLDACGGPTGSAVDHRLLDLLRETGTAATLFINQRWAEENAEMVQELVDDPLFDVANHGVRHLPLSVSGRSAYGVAGTASLQEAYDEITRNQEFFEETHGVRLKHFRAGTAYTDDVTAEMARRLGVPVVNFSVNLDGGGTYAATDVQAAVEMMGPGDIGIGHFNQPESGTAEGMARALEGARRRGLEWITLEQALA